MNNIELNAILYYADLLSLTDISIPVPDNCKWYFIQAKEDYYRLKDKFLEEGVESIIGHLCNLDALRCINAEQMLKCIHQYSSRRERA